MGRTPPEPLGFGNDDYQEPRVNEMEKSEKKVLSSRQSSCKNKVLEIRHSNHFSKAKVSKEKQQLLEMTHKMSKEVSLSKLEAQRKSNPVVVAEGQKVPSSWNIQSSSASLGDRKLSCPYGDDPLTLLRKSFENQKTMGAKGETQSYSQLQKVKLLDAPPLDEQVAGSGRNMQEKSQVSGSSDRKRGSASMLVSRGSLSNQRLKITKAV
jgi:hypothetical protein